MRYNNYFTLLIFIFIFIFIVFSANAQPYFVRHDSIKVKINGNDIDNPWAGGLNFIQISNIDLNLDGTDDLFTFDRTGNKIRTFINKGTANASDFQYAPEYEKKFPDLHDWALLADYNCDGKADIFSYSDIGGGMKIYKNTSSIATGLQFTLVTPLLYSVFNPPNGSLINLYVSLVDIPAISDIDGDGDLDIVTFAITGTYLEYHLNKSKELYGTCDSLKFEMANRCWGYASEAPFDNNFTLNDTCFGNVPNPQMAEYKGEYRNGEKRHSGSCELCIDLNGDGDKDLIVGDIGANNLTMLTNGGTPTAGHFVAVDTAFPKNNSSTLPVDLTIFPCAYYVDVNTDGKKDLIISPNAPNASENTNSMIYYENIGTNNFPVFDFQQYDFLQDNMIEVGEGAYPAVFDYDNDGLKDLFLGNYGYYNSPAFENKIAYLKNTGTTTNPKFDLITRDFNNMSSAGIVNMVPTFGDMDGDGDGDMIIGGYDGKLHYYQNTASTGAPANFVLAQANLKNSNNRTIDVGDFAAPHIADVDGDGKNDLVIGARNGRLAFYKRLNATGAPQLDSISHFWGNVKVNMPGYITGYSFPYVFKHNNKTELLVGSELGYLHRYDNIDGNLTGTFNRVDSTFHFIREGLRTAPTGSDINNDGHWDLFIGNYSGGVAFYKGSATSSSINDMGIDWNFEIFPNPANNSFTVKIVNAVNKKYTLELYNTLGQKLLSEQILDKVMQINIENFSSGIYICNIIEEPSANKLVKKLIIK